MPIASTYYARYNVRIAFAADVLGSSVVTGAISEIVTTDLDANRALISDASGKIITSSTVTSTELAYIAGVTSSVQTQLDAKEGTVTKGNLTEATSSVLTITGGTNSIIGSGVTIEVDQADTSNDGYLSSSDWNTFNGKLGTSLTDAYVFVGNSSNIAAGVAISGDITLANDGTVAIASGVIVDADVNASAAITRTKLATGTAYRILANNASGVISENAAITASRAVVSDANGQLAASTVTTTELGYVSGLTSALQTQLDELIAGNATSSIVQTPTASQHLYSLVWDNNNSQWDLQASGSGGSLTGPTSSTDNAIVRWDGTGGTAAQDSGILIDDSDNITGVTTITLDLAGLHMLDTDASHDLIVTVGSNLTADRTLTLTTGDSDRTITLSGNPTLGDWFDQSVKAAASVVFADVTLSNAGGLHILDSDSSHDLIVTTSSNLTADRTLTLVPGDANRTLTINASGTVYVTGGTDVTVADGGTGLSSIAALSILVANVSNTFVALTPGAGESIRINAGGTAWEAYTPGGGAVSGLTTGRIPFATSSTTLSDDADLSWDNINKVLVLGGPPSGGMSIFADYSPNRDNLIFSDGMADWAGVLGLDNFGVGSGALYSLYAGSHNHAIGAGAGGVITNAEYNELIGRSAGGTLVAGGHNIIIGAFSDAGASSSGNVLLGYNVEGPTSGSYHVLIGYNVESVHPTASGELSIQNAIYGVGNTGTTTTLSTGNIGIYVQSPTARLHLVAGEAGAGKAPLKLTDGTALTTPEDGALEYHSSHLYFTIGSTRYQLDQQGGGGGWPLTGSETLTGDVTMSGAYSVGIGATPTAKFHVKGLGTTTGSLLLLEDSGGTDRLLMADNGSATFYSSYGLSGGKVQSYHFDQVNTTGNPINGAFMRLSPDVRTSTGTSSEWSNLSLDGLWYHGAAATQMASELKIESVLSTWVAAYNAILFAPSHNISSGTGTSAQLNIKPTYNYTGTYAGNVYGIYYNPTLTSMTGVTHIAAAFASGNVVIGASTGNANAILDLQSTTKAFIPPRMTTTQRDAIGTPSAGMVIYNTTTNKLNVYTTAWEAVTSS